MTNMSNEAVASTSSEEIATVFDNLPGHFQCTDGKLQTQEFLTACRGVVVLIEKFGKVFAPVIYDMNGNIKKLSDKYMEDTVNNEFIEEMIVNYKNAGDGKPAEALMWLRRGLHFLARFFQMVMDDMDLDNSTRRNKDLSPLIKNAYRETLERYHGWLGAQLFNILSRFIPNRRQFFFALANDQHDREEVVLRELRTYTQRMYRSVHILLQFYEINDLETHERV